MVVVVVLVLVLVLVLLLVLVRTQDICAHGLVEVLFFGEGEQLPGDRQPVCVRGCVCVCVCVCVGGWLSLFLPSRGAGTKESTRGARIVRGGGKETAGSVGEGMRCCPSGAARSRGGSSR